MQKVNENRIEVIFPSFLSSKVIQTLRKAHPYEEVAYYLNNLENTNQEVGSGIIGEIDESDEISFLQEVKEKNGLWKSFDILRYSIKK